MSASPDFDDNGWARGAVAPLDPAEAWTLLSPEPDARVDAARWAHQAETFFRARLLVVQAKRYPSGTLPLADLVEIDLTGPGGAVTVGGELLGPRSSGAATRVQVVTVPSDRAPAALAAGAAGVRAIGGAGFDALLPRTRRVWQVRERLADPTGDARAPLAVAAILASLFLSPVVPPEGGAIFGVKGARERLAARGWR